MKSKDTVNTKIHCAAKYDYFKNRMLFSVHPHKIRHNIIKNETVNMIVYNKLNGSMFSSAM